MFLIACECLSVPVSLVEFSKFKNKRRFVHQQTADTTWSPRRRPGKCCGGSKLQSSIPGPGFVDAKSTSDRSWFDASQNTAASLNRLRCFTCKSAKERASTVWVVSGAQHCTHLNRMSKCVNSSHLCEDSRPILEFSLESSCGNILQAA